MSAMGTPRTLPEELISIVCDHYAARRQLASLAQLMRLNRRTSAYARAALYRQYDFIDDRTSRFLEGADTICDEYDGGESLDEDILSAIDCRAVDPLDLDHGARWLRSMRSVRTVEIRDMLYGRDTESLLALTRCLAGRGILLFPRLEEVVISAQVVRRIHAAEAKYPKSTPMDTLIILFLGSRTLRLRIADSTAFAPRVTYTNSLGHTVAPLRPLPISLPLPGVGYLAPPHERAHLSDAIIQYVDGMHSLREVVYDRVDPYVPVRPKRGVKHTISFRPYVPPPPTPSPSSSRSSSSMDVDGEAVDERSYIWEIREAMVAIVQRSVVIDTHSDSEQEDNDEATDNTTPPPLDTPSGQSSWHFILPFSTQSSEWAGTLRLQVRDRIRRKYNDPELVEAVLANMSFEFKDG